MNLMISLQSNRDDEWATTINMGPFYKCVRRKIVFLRGYYYFFFTNYNSRFIFGAPFYPGAHGVRPPCFDNSKPVIQFGMGGFFFVSTNHERDFHWQPKTDTSLTPTTGKCFQRCSRVKITLYSLIATDPQVARTTIIATGFFKSTENSFERYWFI